MENVTPEKKEKMTKNLALVGLVGLIILIAWLSVQIVKIFPSAINSLASLADTVYNYEPKNNPVSNPDFVSDVTKSVNSGEPVNLKWQNLGTGDYTFSYTCAEGLSVELRTPHTDIKNVECGIRYDIGTVGSMELIARSAKAKTTDLTYVIAHYKKNSTVPEVEEGGLIKIINPNFEETAEATSTETNTITTNTEIKKSPTVSTVTNEVKYEVPVSDPKGYSDLAISYLGIGQVTKTGTFASTGYFSTVSKNAIQISVKNLGTKNSSAWDLEVELPQGMEYSATGKTLLKPNEEAILTIEFPALSASTLEKFAAQVTSKGEKSNSNNSFTTKGLVK